MIPAPRTTAGGCRLLLLAVALLLALGSSLGPVAAQEGKPSVPAAPATQPDVAPAPPEPKATPGGVAEAAQTSDALGLIQSAVSETPARSCSGTQVGDPIITTTEYAPVASCTLTVPVTTTVYLSANASLGLADATKPFEGMFTLTLDGNSLFTSRRWVNVYTDSGDGTDEAVVSSRLVTVAPGNHTFGFQGRRTSSGDGNIKVYSPVVTAIAIPPGSGLQICASNQGNWSNANNSFTEVASCTITTTITGTVFLDANASVGLQDSGSNYEGQFRFGLDGNEIAIPSRWVNIYTDSGDGTDKNLALARLLTVGPGTHTFKLLGRRYTVTPGTAQVYDPQLSAIFIPSGSPVVRSCAGPIQDFANNTTNFATVSSCSLTVPITTTVFLHATASVGMPSSGAANYEGIFRLALDDFSLIPPTRYINIYTDSGDGTDKSVALSRQITVGPGTHTFKFQAARYGSGGPLQLFLGNITVLALNDLPTITALPDQTVYPNTLVPLQFTVGSNTVAPSNLTITATSSDQAVLPVAKMKLGGSGTTRTLEVTPIGIGSTTITITVGDGANNSTSSFVLTVVPRVVYVPIAAKS